MIELLLKYTDKEKKDENVREIVSLTLIALFNDGSNHPPAETHDSLMVDLQWVLEKFVASNAEDNYVI